MINTKIIESQTQFTIILVVFTLSVFIMPISPFGDFDKFNLNDENFDENYFDQNSPTKRSLALSYTGIGDPLTVNQFANSTTTGQTINVDGIATIWQSNVWEGYRLVANIYDLTDERDWITNGAFTGGNASWTRNYTDVGETNFMNGSWFQDLPTTGDQCLFLQMDTSATDSHDGGDFVYWYQNITIDRSDAVNASFSCSYYLNGSSYTGAPPRVRVSAYIGDYSTWTPILDKGFRDLDADTWSNLTVQYVGLDALWSLIDQYLPGDLAIRIGIEIDKDFSPGAPYSEQIYLDNVTLTIKAKAKPRTIDLELNNTNIADSPGYGVAYHVYEPSSTWLTDSGDPYVKVSFTTNSSDIVELTCDIMNYARSTRPTQTAWSLNPSYYTGINFAVDPDQNVTWSCYFYAKIPESGATEYEHYNYSFLIPNDWNMIDLTDPDGIPQLSNVYFSTQDDKILVMVPSSVASTEGWWEMCFTSVNYAEEASMQKFNSDWENTTWILVGNTTRGAAKLSARSGSANITVFDPHGTLWFTDLDDVNAITGEVYFDSKMVNATSYAGKYTSYVSWSNGTEVGYTYTTFLIIHNSELTAKKTVYEFESTGGEISAYIKVYFKDLDNDGTDIYYPVHLPQKPSITGTWTENRTIDFLWSVDEITGEAGYIGFYDLSGLSPDTYDTAITAAVEGYSDVSTGTPLNAILQISFVLKEPSEAGGVSTTAFIGLSAAVGIALVSFFTWYAHFRLPLVVRIINRNISQIKTGQIPPPSNMPTREERVKDILDELNMGTIK